MLHWAVSNVNVDLSKYLIKLNADPDVEDLYGRSAVALARETGQFDLVSHRLQLGFFHSIVLAFSLTFMNVYMILDVI